MGRERARARKHIYLCITSLVFLSLFDCATIKDAGVRKEAQEYLLSGQKLLAQRNYDGAIDEYQKVLSLSPKKVLEDEAFFNMGLVYAHTGNPRRNYEKSLNFFLKVVNDYPDSPLCEQARIWAGVLSEYLKTTKKLESPKEVEEVKETISDREGWKEVAREQIKTKHYETRPEEYAEGNEYLLRSQKLLAQGNYEGAIAQNQKILSVRNARSPKAEALFNLGLIYAHPGNPQKNVEKSIDFFNILIKNYPKSPFVEQAKIWVGILKENEELGHLIRKLREVDIEIEEKKRERTQ